MYSGVVVYLTELPMVVGTWKILKISCGHVEGPGVWVYVYLVPFLWAGVKRA